MIRIENKKEILKAFEIPYDEFKETYQQEAKRIHTELNKNVLVASAMMGFDNVCKNQCLYCGMRAGNKTIKRYRLDVDTIVQAAASAYELGFRRIFLISGEDPKYGFENLLSIAERTKKLGLWVSFGCGEFSLAQYRELHAAGVDEYVLKFEMSNRDNFNRLNPSTDYDKRLRSAAWIKQSGMQLASGNIVDYPGQTLDELADDILLMKELDISWAPVIPFLPAKNTPLAQESDRGSLEKNLREISILRIMMPKINITAQQPGNDPAKGLADPEGNLDALFAGANMLFADLLPDALTDSFRVVDNRTKFGLEHIKAMASFSGMDLAGFNKPKMDN